MTTSVTKRWTELTRRLYAQNQFAVKLGLDSMNQALALSGLTSLSHKIVLVAGTNGKGTIASTMASLMRAAGLKVGLYTSPHIKDFSERFRINGDIVAQEDLLEIAEPIMERFAHTAPRLTFFELTTLMAVQLFEHQGVDVAIYEVGLGGRLDATNALSPDLCVLACIGYDHQKYLGDSLQDILGEKLGIVRADVPLFVSGQEYREVSKSLTLLRHTPLYCYNRNLGLSDEFDPARKGPGHHVWWYSKGVRHELGIPSWGQFQAAYQRRHVTTALAASDYMLTHVLHRTALCTSVDVPAIIPTLKWPGRLDVVRPPEGSEWHHIELLCDAAHNEDGIRALCHHLEVIDYHPDVIICSMLKDKPIESMLTTLERRVVNSEGERPDLYLAQLDNPRASSREELHQVALASFTVGTVPEIMASLKGRGGNFRVLVCGSIYLLGELWEEIGHEVNA